METIRLTSAASQGTRVFLYVHHVWLNTAGSQHLFPHAPHQAQPVRRAGSVQISGQGCVLTVISTGGSCSEASSPSSAPAPCHPPLSVPQPCPALVWPGWPYTGASCTRWAGPVPPHRLLICHSPTSASELFPSDDSSLFSHTHLLSTQ